MEYRVRVIIEERHRSDNKLRRSGAPWRSRFVKLVAASSTPTERVEEAWELYDRLAADLRDIDARRNR